MLRFLLNPYSSIAVVKPWYETHWTPHWVAVQITIRSETVLVANVYAPSGKAERATLFECFDITCWNTKDPCSWEGISIARWRLDLTVLSSRLPVDMIPQLCDVLENDMERAEEERAISAFHATAHTYFYTFPGGGSASSRLDR